MVEVIKMGLLSKHHRLQIGTLAAVGIGWHTGRTKSPEHAKILGMLGIGISCILQVNHHGVLYCNYAYCILCL